MRFWDAELAYINRYVSQELTRLFLGVWSKAGWRPAKFFKGFEDGGLRVERSAACPFGFILRKRLNLLSMRMACLRY